MPSSQQAGLEVCKVLPVSILENSEGQWQALLNLTLSGHQWNNPRLL